MAVQAQAASFLPGLVPLAGARAVLQRECWRCPSSVPWGARQGAGSRRTADKGESDPRCQAASPALGGQRVSWRSRAARRASTVRLSWWPGLSVGQRRGALLSCLSSCAGGVCGESHHHCASRHLAGGRRDGEAKQCQAFHSWGIKPIVY